MELTCSKCNAELNEKMNYCPNCGEPLSLLAKKRETLKHDNAGLEMLAKLTLYTKNPELLKIIKDFVNKN